LVDSRLRLNPDQTAKLLKHQDGFAVQLEVRGITVALFFVGFEAEEINPHIKRFQATYAAVAVHSISSLRFELCEGICRRREENRWCGIQS
jgi:hypothetical protein